jgi:hypothetical protein
MNLFNVVTWTTASAFQLNTHLHRENVLEFFSQLMKSSKYFEGKPRIRKEYLTSTLHIYYQRSFVIKTKTFLHCHWLLDCLLYTVHYCNYSLPKTGILHICIFYLKGDRNLKLRIFPKYFMRTPETESYVAYFCIFWGFTA